MRKLLKTAAVWCLDLVLRGVEQLFPPIPEITEDLAAKYIPDYGWQPADEYYFVADPSRRLWDRVRAVLTLDRSAVSFYRKRGVWQRRYERTMTWAA